MEYIDLTAINATEIHFYLSLPNLVTVVEYTRLILNILPFFYRVKTPPKHISVILTIL